MKTISRNMRAGLALEVNTNLHPSIPLMAGAKENSFKLFLFDIGLLGAMINLNPESILCYDYGEFKGESRLVDEMANEIKIEIIQGTRLAIGLTEK